MRDEGIEFEGSRNLGEKVGGRLNITSKPVGEEIASCELRSGEVRLHFVLCFLRFARRLFSFAMRYLTLQCGYQLSYTRK